MCTTLFSNKRSLVKSKKTQEMDHKEAVTLTSADAGSMGPSVSLDDINRKRGLSEMEGVDDYEDDEDESGDYGKGDSKDGKRTLGKRSRRHNWQPKYEMEFGLLAIERDPTSGDVTLAMCGFCKAFGREGKYDQLIQADADAGNDAKKRRRRSLTTTKFFRAFRVDNIRCHLMGAHPRRWVEYEMLPKQEAARSRYLQMHGEYQYDGLSVDDASLHTEHDTVYSTSVIESTQGETSTHTGASNASTAMALRSKIGVGSRTQFDYEKHLVEQLAFEREKLEFEKARFKQEVELRERELLQRERMMEQDAKLHLERQQIAVVESAKLDNLAEVLRHVHAPVV